VTELQLGENACSAVIEAPWKAWVWVSLAPVSGWRWRLDGQQVTLEQGPGIVQYLEVSPGRHRLEGRYLPPGHLLTTIVSGCAVVVVLFGMARDRKRE